MADTVETFAALFRGRTDALGTNRGGVERTSVIPLNYARHLEGTEAIGIFPMLDDNTVWFGAIDLDEPNFELARTMQKLIPGASWVERSRSGNAHVWVFFERPAPAWAVRTVLRGATEAVGRRDVEIFPKQDALKPGMVGNYINLPLFGDERPILRWDWKAQELMPLDQEFALHRMWTEGRQDPDVWVKRARMLGGQPPEEREAPAEFGTRKRLHECADYIITNRESNPITKGHRNVVLFNLTRMLLNWEAMTPYEARTYVNLVNEAGTDPLPERDVDRIFENVQQGQWTSTGCDDPVMAPFVRPDCPIANGEVGR